MPTSYLITGGAGFIGSHLTDALLARGDHVVALDNLSTGRLSNLDAAGSHPNFRFVQGSVLDELIVDELTHTCEVVVHLAAAVGVKLIVEEPLRSLTTNIRGSEIVIEAAHRYRRKIVIASTSEIYGKNSSGALAETADRILGSPKVRAGPTRRRRQSTRSSPTRTTRNADSPRSLCVSSIPLDRVRARPTAW